jgi:glycogen debranching enzyme
MQPDPQQTSAPAHLPDPGNTHEPRVPLRLYALKQDDSFLVADAYGDIVGTDDGFFRDDTRVLSRFTLRLGGRPPSLLAATMSQDNVFFFSHMTNRPLPPLGEESTPEGVIHIERARLLWNGSMFERITLANYSERASRIPITIGFGADFYDMFEVRGIKRMTRGRTLLPVVKLRSVELRYEGLDNVVRTSVISFSETPKLLTGDAVEFQVNLEKKGRHEIYLEVGSDAAEADRARFRAAAARARVSMRARRRRGATLRSSGRLFNDWISKSHADLALLTTDLDTGPYPYAGVPWFSTAFGRDAIITSLQVLWLDPSVAKGVLRFLACNQATTSSAFQDAAPGKILHEVRKGEMTAVGELPFAQSYASVDSTPLFLMLACAYADRTGDVQFIDELWPSLLQAVRWIDEAGDVNRDGFVDYTANEFRGLANQGWKDSTDSIFLADGRLIESPVAVIEVQGYVYAALIGLADLAVRRGEGDLAARWADQAQKLRELVEDRFWMPEHEFYGIAIDGRGELCRVRASNPGHILYSGLPTRERARAVSEKLLSPNFNTGWGIRTLATNEVRFNPMSYHNGSVWPHDTAMCAAGMARYGERDGVVRLLSGLFEAAARFDMRLPELFCGFPRASGESPIAYPVACLPQAWSAGSIFMIMQACLGISVNAWRSEIRVVRPHLPIGIDHLIVRGLKVGAHNVDLMFQRVGHRVVVLRQGNNSHEVRISVDV